jgi:arylsulfatase A-like enzyme
MKRRTNPPFNRRAANVLLQWATVLLLLPPLTSCSRRQQQSPPAKSATVSTTQNAPATAADCDVGNVILISVDTLRADRLNCCGYNERTISPNIDALAADGILFENHITTSPWTTPAHLSMLTSLYPSAHGVTATFRDLMDQLEQNRLFTRLPDSVTTLAEVLTANGFTSAAFTAGLAVDPKIGFDQGFMTYTTDMYKLDDENMGRLIDWFENLRDLRLFVFWHTFEVHAPYTRTTFLADVLPADTVTLIRDGIARMAELTDAPVLTPQDVAQLLSAYGAYNRQVCDTLYVGGVHSFDRWLGHLIQSLRDRDLYDRSLIILTSDHGEEFADHNASYFYDWHGHTLYEELLRVPLIIKLPAQQHAGMRVATVSSTIDIMPTILDLLTIDAARLSMQGVSLRPLWERHDSAGTGPAFGESLADPFEKKCIRTDRYKYVVSIGAESVARRGRHHIPDPVDARELYDLHTDPAEKSNLLDSPDSTRYTQLADELDRALRRQLGLPAGRADRVRLDPETIERLKALGYIGPRPTSPQAPSNE